MKKVFIYKKTDLRNPKRVFYKTAKEIQNWNVPLSIKKHWKIEKLLNPIISTEEENTSNIL